MWTFDNFPAAGERIAAARFGAHGTSVYPDATFTLRLNYRTVQGWVKGERPVAPFTYLGRAYERHTRAEPFQLPERWLQARDRLDPRTPFNFSTNNDIVGGNSGSLLVNAKGGMVGLIFDGNIHAISGTYWFDTETNRAVAVHLANIRVAPTDLCGSDWLVHERCFGSETEDRSSDGDNACAVRVIGDMLLFHTGETGGCRQFLAQPRYLSPSLRSR